jgi:N-methylhydantoinase B
VRGIRRTDPVELALGQKQVDHVARTMGWVMTRTARSPIFSQSHDFSCFIGDARGQVVSQADGIPIHTGAGGFGLRRLLEEFDADINPGDVFILNDPYEAGGNHLPDWTVIRPVFVRDLLVAFTANRAHQSDIGGGAAGTYNAAATEIFHEGIRLPVMKLIAAGEPRRDVMRMLYLNSRTPDLAQGDLAAMLGSTEVGARRLVALAKSMGPKAFQDLLADLLDWGEVVMREALAKLPIGHWRGDDFMGTDCFAPTDAKVRVTVTNNGDGLVCDFAGTDAQVRGFKNSSYANTCSAVYLSVIATLGAHIPRNEGAYRPISVVAPKGSIVNPQYPAAVTLCTTYPAHQIVHAVWKALGEAMPELACAGWSRASHCNTSGIGRNGRFYVAYQWLGMSGAGAVDGRDGFETMGHMATLGGLTLPDVETFEADYPFHVRRNELRMDGGGPGLFRGGTGALVELDVLLPAEYSYRGEGTGAQTSFGVAGGSPGDSGACHIVFPDGKHYEPPQYGVEKLGPLRLTISSAGGGGFGDPHSRNAERVREDVRDGLVSREAAGDAYGVVLGKAPGFAIDVSKTEALRSARATKLPSQP